MIKINPIIEECVQQLEIQKKSKLNYPNEIKELLQIVSQTGLTNEFEELIFTSKFIVRTQEIMKRIGSSANEFSKLSSEYQSSINKVVEIIKTLVNRTSDEIIHKYDINFFGRDETGLSNLLDLLYDLNTVKNWKLDGNPLPYESKPNSFATSRKTTDVSYIKQTKSSLRESFDRIKKSAILAAIFLILLLLIDPPVTILGWMIALGISAMLAYIILQIALLTRIK